MNIGWNSYNISVNNFKTYPMTYAINEINTESNFVGSNSHVDKIISSNYNFRSYNSSLYPNKIFE